MRVLVTGAAGFAGSGLCRRLLAAGHEVTGLDLIAPEEAKVGRLGPEPFAHKRFHYIWGAVEELRPFFDGPHVVVHLAAQGDVDLGFVSPRYTAQRNIDATVSLLEFARGSSTPPPVFIYASSAHAMEQSAGPEGMPGSYPRRLNEYDELRPSTPYGFSKAAGEMACWTWHRCYGLPVTVMSNGVVAGTGMRREHFLWKWLTAIYRGEPVVLEGGAQTRDLTYVDDVLDAWILAIEAPREKVVGEKFQVSYGEEHTVAEILDFCFAVTGRIVPVVRRPYRPGEEGMRECFSTEKARSVLGFQPKVSPYNTVRLTWEYVQSELARQVEGTRAEASWRSRTGPSPQSQSSPATAQPAAHADPSSRGARPAAADSP